MAKYSFEFKKKIVDEYIKGEGGYRHLAKKHGVASHKNIAKWVANYQAFGSEALLRSRQPKEYTLEYKLHVVELYLTNEVSYQELAIQEGITNPSLIVRWVNDFRIAGPDALRPKKGRKKALKLSEKKSAAQLDSGNGSADASGEQLQQLKEENLKLRIENAYLKELRRLRLEEEALLKKQRELYTASEENSN